MSAHYPDRDLSISAKDVCQGISHLRVSSHIVKPVSYRRLGKAYKEKHLKISEKSSGAVRLHSQMLDIVQERNPKRWLMYFDLFAQIGRVVIPITHQILRLL